MIATHLPNFDLSAGPRVEFDGSDVFNQPEPAHVVRGVEVPDSSPPRGSGPNKRSHDAVAQDDSQRSFNSEARSVALDLGRLSLNADSREKHYLGSSSGLIFSYLIGTPPSTADEPVTADLRKTVTGSSQNRQTFELCHRLLVAVCELLDMGDDSLTVAELAP